MTVEIKTGDLLAEQTDAIVNTVNCVGIMGKGIALQFKQRWPENYKAYAAACKSKKIQTGKMFVFELGALAPKPHFIINFPTKNHWREKSKPHYIDEGLEDLIKVIKLYKIKSIAIPPLGCGNGGLEWGPVKEKIIKAFDDLGENIAVHLYEPGGAPRAQSMVSRTKKPNLTPTRAFLIKLLSIYKQLNYSLSSIEVQKLAYFGSVLGSIPRLNFEKNQYGPYAHNLNHVLDSLNGHFIQGVGDHDKIKSEIEILPKAIKESNEMIAHDKEALFHIERISNLIEGFETPYGMELLSTVHWVAQNKPHAKNYNEAIEAIYKWSDSHPHWNERKKSTLQKEHIKIAWHRLEKEKWINDGQTSH